VVEVEAQLARQEAERRAAQAARRERQRKEALLTALKQAEEERRLKYDAPMAKVLILCGRREKEREGERSTTHPPLTDLTNF
jgi:hypothetical protein